MTMEDVWKDISLASLCEHNSPAAANSATTNDRAALRGFIFQDFLAAASTKLAPASGLAAAPPPTTLLSLSSSGSDQHQIQSTATFITNNTSAPVKPNPQRLHGTSTTSSSLISLSANNLPVALDCKKRAVEESGDNSRRVRHRRMIKNRESASRSRARKQAYTNELELELAHLQVENARLKRQQAKFSLAAPAAAAAAATTTSRLLKKAHSL